MAILAVTVGAVKESSAQTIEVDKPASLVTGNYMVMLASSADAGGAIDISIDEASQPWTLIKQEKMSAGLDGTLALFYRKITGAEAAAITVNISGGTNRSITGVIAQYSGVDATTALDAAATSTTDQNTTDYDPPAITTVTANAFVITAVYGRVVTIGIPNAPSGYTKYGTAAASTSYTGMAYIDAGATGSEDPAVWASFTNAADCMGITMALKPAGGGGGGAEIFANHLFSMQRNT